MTSSAEPFELLVNNPRRIAIQESIMRGLMQAIACHRQPGLNHYARLSSRVRWDRDSGLCTRYFQITPNRENEKIAWATIDLYESPINVPRANSIFD